MAHEEALRLFEVFECSDDIGVGKLGGAVEQFLRRNARAAGGLEEAKHVLLDLLESSSVHVLPRCSKLTIPHRPAKGETTRDKVSDGVCAGGRCCVSAGDACSCAADGAGGIAVCVGRTFRRSKRKGAHVLSVLDFGGEVHPAA